MYEPLTKWFYKEIPCCYTEEYMKRFTSYGTVKLPFHIKPFKSQEEFICFYVNHQDLDMLHDNILKQSKMIQAIELPGIAIQHYIRAKLIEELMSTNEIEGVRSTKQEMEAVLEIVLRKEKKIERHLSLMKSYFSLISEKHKSIKSAEQIRDIYDQLVHQEIKPEDRPDGELFRAQPVDVVTSTGKVIHKGVHPEQAIIFHLNQMIQYLNEFRSPMLYKIAIAHYYFGYIHPFYDGNGRTSRYISSMYLMDELDPLTALSLSHSTNKHKSLYYEAFEQVNHPHNKGELTFFVEAFFEIIHKAQHDILDDLAEKQGKMKRLVDRIGALEVEDALQNNILFWVGQHYIFGIEGRGLTKKEIMDTAQESDYKVTRALNELHKRGTVEFLKRKPIEVTLSDSLREML